jgi:dTDP-4-amino-4,6-dideoxygalactose transaminase
MSKPSEMSKPIYVTQPYLPPLEEFLPYLEEIWERKVLTNGGPFHAQLEEELRDHLKVPYVSLFVNGTLALVSALQELRITGEVITTPHSFVATSHSLLWNGIRPIFVDVEPDTLNLDPAKVEAAITAQTTAILAVHCFGHPCDVHAIKKIADTYNLKVIYDAAHAFGVEVEDGSVLNHGDLSVLSFHATKVFTTFEGGAIVSAQPEAKRRIDWLKNFGYVDETTVMAPGINGKMTEFSAALGLLQLRHLDHILERRAAVDRMYRERLADVNGIVPLTRPTTERVSNYSYFPILVDADHYPISRDELNEALKARGIVPRRYFYPLISEFPMYRGLPSASPANLPVATAASRQILCLPIYPDLELTTVERIADIIAEYGAHH